MKSEIEDVTTEDEEEQQAGKELNRDYPWFVVHAYSGQEQTVAQRLRKRVESMNMQDKIFHVLVPVEERVEVKNGQRKTVEYEIFPGYILVQMEMTDESWYVVRNTPGVTGFVSSGNTPVPLDPAEVEAIQHQMGQEQPKPRIDVEVGESVRVTAGPFDGFIGAVDQIDVNKGKVRVLVNMFGRETPVELDFSQVDKL